MNDAKLGVLIATVGRIAEALERIAERLPETTVPPPCSTPPTIAFVIDGPGTYRRRDGGLEMVVGPIANPQYPNHVWRRSTALDCPYSTWRTDGRLDDSEPSDADLVAKYVAEVPNP